MTDQLCLECNHDVARHAAFGCLYRDNNGLCFCNITWAEAVKATGTDDYDLDLVERVAWTIVDDPERAELDGSWLDDARRVLDLLVAEGRLCEP
jgi:hypothetical protein